MFDVYVDRKFLEKFSAKKLGLSFEDEHEWSGLRNFLIVNNNTNVHDIDGAALNKSDLIRVFFDRTNPPEQRVDYSCCICHENISNPFSMVLLEKDKEELKQFTDHGFLSMNSDTWAFDWQKITNHNPIAVSEKFWKDLKKRSHPSNYFIMIDRYILSNSSERIYSNHIRIMKNLIANSKYLKGIIIFCSGDENVKARITPEELYELLKENLPEKMDLQVLYTIKYQGLAKKLLHDRFIITNYYSVLSGNSFHYFDEKNNIICNSEINFNPLVDQVNFQILTERMKGLVEWYKTGKPELHSLGKDLLSSFMGSV